MKTFSKIKILYVEDNLDDVYLVKESFDKFSVMPTIIDVAYRGEDGLNMLKKTKYNFMLLDYHLPDYDGIKVLYEAKKLAPNLPVVMITGIGNEDVALLAISYGATSYIPKRSGYYKELPENVYKIISGEPEVQKEILYLKEKRKILLIDDEVKDLELTMHYLIKNNPHFEIDTAKSAEEALDKIFSGNLYDIILSDLKLNGIDAIELIKRLKRRNIRIPVNIITGKGGEEEAVKALQTGAYDYVVKRGNYLDQLALSIEGSITRFELNKMKLENQKRIEEENLLLEQNVNIKTKQLKVTEEKYHSLFDKMLDGLAYCKMIFDEENDPVDFIYLEVNKSFGTLTGLKNVVGKKVSEVIPGIREVSPELFLNCGSVAKTGKPMEFEFDFKSLNQWLNLSVYCPEPGYFITLFSNITQRKRAEEQLRQSELRFRQISESAHEWIWEVNKNGVYKFVNPLITELLGYSPEELIGKKYFYDFFDPENKEEMKQKALAAFSRKESFRDFINCNIHKDGRKIFLSTTGFPILDAENNLIGYRGADIDITEKIIAEEKLKRSERNFREAERIADTGSWEYDLASDMASWSQNMFRIFDVEPEKTKALFSKYFFEQVVHPDDSSHVLSEFSEAVSGKGEYDVEYRIVKNDKSIRYIHAIAERVYNQNNSVIKMVGWVQDITERKLAEEEIARMANILEATPDLVGMSDVKGNVFYLNQGGKELMGIPKDEDVTKLKISDFQPKGSARLVISEALPYAAKEGYWSGETKLLSRTGEEIPVLQVVLCHKDSKNQVTHYSTIVRDIRDSKRAEEKVQKLSLAVEQSPVTVVITNKKGEIEYVNNKFFELTGYTTEEVKGKNPKILKSGHHSKEFYKDLWDTILSGKVWRGEMLNKKKNGEIYWESESISPVVNKKGEITHFVAMKEDITEKMKMISDLFDAKEKAESASKLKDAFINNISHEIRTPLNGILGLSSLIKENYSQYIQEGDESLFTGIDLSGQRIVRTVDMILNYSRLQIGEFTVTPKEIDLCRICESVIKQNKETAAEKYIELLFENRCKEAKIAGDEYSITQIVSNLIENAVKYTKKGRVEIALLPGTAGSVIFEAKDTGVGIAEEYIEHLFEPYRQEEMGYIRSFEGLGLGLALTKKYVDLNKAAISVESKKGEGTTFRVTFIKAGIPQMTETDLIKKEKASTPANLKKETTILVVEDDLINQNVFQRSLNKKHKLFFADSAEVTYDVLMKNKIDLILMDISINGEIDGLELTKELRETKKYAQIPVIAVTAHAGNEVQRNALEAGCNDYLAKPFTMDHLFKKIGKFV